MNQPTFFLSSTIYDFADLRSSVKYFLEDQGATVLASEYNDFIKPLDTHSYDACLEAIKRADYFVLFIGSRVGGWFDKESEVSITQQEYRTAYELHKQGKLKIITFVRDQIWQFKENRNELTRYLKEMELEPSQREKLTNYPSKSVSDAEFIINFINEVGRNKETKEALKSGLDMPTGNWIHCFNNFKEVIDVLNIQVFSGRPKDQALVRDLLCSELEDILKKLLIKVDHGKVLSPTYFVRKFHESHDFKLDVRDQEEIFVDSKLWDNLSSLSISLLGKEIQTKILDHALLTNTFMSFSIENNRFVPTPEYKTLSNLHY